MSIEYKVSEVIPSLIIPLATLPFTSNPLDGEHETYHTLIRSHNPFERMDQMCGHKPKLSHKISGISDRALLQCMRDMARLAPGNCPNVI